MEQPRVHVSVVVEAAGDLLMVQEGKPDVQGKWNLPGGHVEVGETVTGAAVREVREETGLDVEVSGLVGVFVSPGAIRFVLRARQVGGAQAPGHDIMSVRHLGLEGLQALDDAELDAPEVLRAIFDRLTEGEDYPLEVLVEGIG